MLAASAASGALVEPPRTSWRETAVTAVVCAVRAPAAA
ncbi:hypothetical protein GA0115251_137240, partial [Streptomyces sp. TverLS-915]